LSSRCSHWCIYLYRSGEIKETVVDEEDGGMEIGGLDLVRAAALLGAGISMGFGAIGPGVGEGLAAAKACEAIGRNPREAGLLTRTMLVGQAVSESTGIYSLVVALLLIFVV
jgi:F-type H+-transporting ATPase subunit c